MEILWLTNNCLNEFKSLSNEKLKRIKEINLLKNKIDDISGLEQFVKSHNNLETLYLQNNSINLSNDENKEIIEKFKKNEKIKVVFFPRDLYIY